MYSIYADGVCIYNDTFPLDNMKVVNPKLILEENGAGSLSLTLPPSNAGYETIERLVSDICVQKEGKELWSGRVLSEEKDFWNNRVLFCEGELGFFNDSTQPQAEYRAHSVKDFLKKLVEVHNSKVSVNRWFEVGTVTVTETDGSMYRYTNYQKTIVYIRELVDKLGGHLRVRKENGVRYLDYLAEYPHTSSQSIRFGENLLDFTRKWDMSDFATVIVPLGARQDDSPIEDLDAYLTVESVNNGSPYVKSQDAVAAYGWIEKVVEWNDVNDPASLLRNAQAYLSDNQFEAMHIELKALDLHYMKVDSESVCLLDQIRVVSFPHGMDRLFPVTKLEIPLDSPENTTFTLGGVVKQGLSDVSNRLSWEYRQKLSEIRTSIIQTADQIRLEVVNELAGLESSFTMEIDKITARVVGTEGRITTLQATADGLQAQILAANGNISTLTATADTLRAQLATANGNITTLTATADSLQSQITSNNNALKSSISTIKQTIDNISLSVSTSAGKASISLTVDGQTKTGKIDLNGYVTFTGLSNGTTTINGGCIQTGNVAANMIKLGGYGFPQHRYCSICGSETRYDDGYCGNCHKYTSSKYAYQEHLKGCLGIFRHHDGNTDSSNFDQNHNAVGYLGASSVNGYESVALFGINGAATHVGSNTFLGLTSLYTVAIQGSSIKLNGRDAASLISDRRLKKDIDYQVTDKLLRAFDGLKPVTFRFNLPEDDGQNHIGFIAQDVEEAVRNADLEDALVAPDCFDRYTLNYGEITAILTAKIRQLEERIEQLSTGVMT